MKNSGDQSYSLGVLGYQLAPVRQQPWVKYSCTAKVLKEVHYCAHSHYIIGQECLMAITVYIKNHTWN